MNRAFLDTNVLIYLVSGSADRARRSAEIVAEGGVISVQVLNEFVRVARRKRSLAWDEIEAWLELFHAKLIIRPLTLEVQVRATRIAHRHQLDIYDANILAAAERAGCNTLYTEDMQHGATIAGVEIRNPY